MSCDSSVCSSCEMIGLKYEMFIHEYLEDEREPIRIRPIPKILKVPRYDESLNKNQRILRNFVVNVRNMYLALCLLNRKGLEYMVGIHRSKENAIIKTGVYPYSDEDYIASAHFDDRLILYPCEMSQFNEKLRKILSETTGLANILRSMWLKLSSLETNPEDIAFNQWTWEAIVFAFEILSAAFWKEHRVLDALASNIVHSSNFTTQRRCLQTWCEQRGIKDADLNLLQALLQEVGVNEPEP